jgi:hypothetical protein
VGHGITKDGQEIQDRDMLANYIFNEVSLDGVKGIGMKPWGAKSYQGFEATPAAQAGPPKVNLTLSQ